MKRKTHPRLVDAGPILDRMLAEDPEFRASVDDETLNLEIAQLVYDARTHGGLTQLQLARLVGTTQPVIARLEDADYRGHSLRMLRRIAAALKKDLEIRFVPRAG
jgi:ribosome-binding protein aMBF1 (putative translation factor)